ncbi:tetraacyldisaccharide 4'-kinase [Pedobacter sp. SYP-B3415]|uniref:tetraacyldisaccharide 4'-kinase n=1 Tax=Pedobacter sp. SYP-B3415 TaxID=2496641 RepID=UPI00101DA19D|nr:tetraacyldisaccharide 4'-kinase [Pedobacter sp. SYP-B3415]
MVSLARLLLLPFAILYGLIIRIRHLLYDTGVFKSKLFDVPIICVGNLAMGGAGKTPHTEYLVKLLQPHFRVAILSRGYGRKTKGYIRATVGSTALTIGDEPMQYLQKFPGVTVAVAERRAEGLHMLQHDHDVVILDDAYQHRAVRPGMSLLLFDQVTLQKKQYLFPAGNLRDVFSARRRADLFIVTKLTAPPAASLQEYFTRRLNPAKQQKIFFSGIRYSKPKPLFDIPDGHIEAGIAPGNAILFTGIANPKPLQDQLESDGWMITPMRYRDHHTFSRGDIFELTAALKSLPADKRTVLTTEKDAQRLLDESLRDLLLNLPVYYIPIEIAFFDEDNQGFDQEILDYVKSAAGNR